jgi:hypothetical protein
MRPIPKSRIVESQYTNGTGIGKNLTLRFVSSKTPYIGFYNIVNGNKYSTGKIFDENSKALEKYNILSTVDSTASKVAALGSVPLVAGAFQKIQSATQGSSASANRYFYKDLSSPDILIKEVDKSAYDKLTGQPSGNYQVISYNSDNQNLLDVNKQMPGLAAFLGT